MLARRHLLPWFALAGVLQPVWTLGGSLVFGLFRPGYQPLRDAISELGEKGAPNAVLWNIGGFGVIAMLYAAYAIAIRAGFGPRWLFRLSIMQAIFIAAGASFDCDPGCPPVPQTATMVGHIVVGLAYFAITTLLPLVAWRTFRRRPGWDSYARPSLAVGAILVALFFIGPTLGEDRVGVWQRTVLLLAYAWQIAVALHLRALLRRAAAADAGDRPEQLATDTPDPAQRGAWRR
jgi:hypothetical protein